MDSGVEIEFLGFLNFRVENMYMSVLYGRNMKTKFLSKNIVSIAIRKFIPELAIKRER